ncbi:hypothetical protein CIPAW_13G025700 [Carya illinoinensis]|uniref:Uncharacterized protein n=1 Tax=Carya illinoinensis TaxID=32201 RepID=A0A8T1NKW8_CARIL|nr:hypothetical protein CIPAW_13G025700 [Carya illinoinensis]
MTSSIFRSQKQDKPDPRGTFDFAHLHMNNRSQKQDKPDLRGTTFDFTHLHIKSRSQKQDNPDLRGTFDFTHLHMKSLAVPSMEYRYIMISFIIRINKNIYTFIYIYISCMYNTSDSHIENQDPIKSR